MTAQPRQKLWKWTPGAPLLAQSDELALEEPLEIRVNRRAVSVTMRTPGHDGELAVGFLHTEGLLPDREAIAEVVERAGLVDVRLAPGIPVDLSRLTRHVFASSSCGICGKATVDAITAQFPPLTVDGPIVTAERLASLPEQLLAAQPAFARTGGLHATALFDADGALLSAREDVGRHNALDKVIGRMLLDGRLPLTRRLLVVSGRASFEIVQKALAARVPVIAALSAPSSLAVEFARDNGITLVGFLRADRMNVYTHPQRLQTMGR